MINCGLIKVHGIMGWILSQNTIVLFSKINVKGSVQASFVLFLTPAPDITQILVTLSGNMKTMIPSYFTT